MTKKRGNPHWGKPDLNAGRKSTPTSFEEVVKRLRLSPAEYKHSMQLKEWGAKEQRPEIRSAGPAAGMGWRCLTVGETGLRLNLPALAGQIARMNSRRTKDIYGKTLGSRFSHSSRIQPSPHKLLFTSTGAARYNSPTSDLLASWDNVTVAREATQLGVKQEGGQISVETVSAYWAKTIVNNWLTLYGKHREQVIQAVTAGQGVITVGFFAQASNGKFNWILALITFDPNRAQPVAAVPSKDLAYCWPCGQAPDQKVCAGGEVKSAALFCSELDSRKRTAKPPPIAKDS